MEDSHNGVNPKEISMADKYEPKDGDMSVFPNDKGDNPARPDYTGKVLIEGKEYRVALWNKTAKSGLEFMSGKATVNDGSGATDVPF